VALAGHAAHRRPPPGQVLSPLQRPSRVVAFRATPLERGLALADDRLIELLVLARVAGAGLSVSLRLRFVRLGLIACIFTRLRLVLRRLRGGTLFGRRLFSRFVGAAGNADPGRHDKDQDYATRQWSLEAHDHLAWSSRINGREMHWATRRGRL